MLWPVWASLGPAPITSTRRYRICKMCLYVLPLLQKCWVYPFPEMGLQCTKLCSSAFWRCSLVRALVEFPCACVCSCASAEFLCCCVGWACLFCRSFPGFALSCFTYFSLFLCALVGGNRTKIKTLILSIKRKKCDRNQLHFASFP